MISTSIPSAPDAAGTGTSRAAAFAIHVPSHERSAESVADEIVVRILDSARV